jgi:thiosulfate reductase cytochrome b subunit
MADMPSPSANPAGDVVYRHRVATRVWHWLNAIAVFTLLMSGLMIFNAHPRLYWGQYGANADRAWLEIGSTPERGFLRIGSALVTTTGVLGRWTGPDGAVQRRAFPHWATLPSGYSLALGRRWHLAFAWVLAVIGLGYWLWGLTSGHVRRTLWPDRHEITAKHIWQDVKDHARLRLPSGQAALRYNILQKLAYLLVLFGLLPLLVLTGLTMSPALNAAWPWLLDLFGGRQSARSLHFVAAMLMLGFIVVHLLMVVLAGPWNEVRSMVTGRFRPPPERAP